MSQFAVSNFVIPLANAALLEYSPSNASPRKAMSCLGLENREKNHPVQQPWFIAIIDQHL